MPVIFFVDLWCPLKLFSERKWVVFFKYLFSYVFLLILFWSAEIQYIFTLMLFLLLLLLWLFSISVATSLDELLISLPFSAGFMAYAANTHMDPQRHLHCSDSSCDLQLEQITLKLCAESHSIDSNYRCNSVARALVIHSMGGKIGNFKVLSFVQKSLLG